MPKNTERERTTATDAKGSRPVPCTLPGRSRGAGGCIGGGGQYISRVRKDSPGSVLDKVEPRQDAEFELRGQRGDRVSFFLSRD